MLTSSPYASSFAIADPATFRCTTGRVIAIPSTVATDLADSLVRGKLGRGGCVA